MRLYCSDVYIIQDIFTEFVGKMLNHEISSLASVCIHLLRHDLVTKSGGCFSNGKVTTPPDIIADSS